MSLEYWLWPGEEWLELVRFLLLFAETWFYLLTSARIFCLILLSVKEPKTRNTAARHQALRVDQPQLVQVVTLAFERMIPSQKLWPLSPSTFRNRFAKLIAALSLDNLEGTRIKPLDLGSLRAGGATWLLQTTEDGELVRRRGRWINTKVMEIYIQEVSSVLFLPRLPKAARDKVLLAAASFPAMLQQALELSSLAIPERIWFSLTAAGTALSPGDNGTNGCRQGSARAAVTLRGGAKRCATISAEGSEC